MKFATTVAVPLAPPPTSVAVTVWQLDVPSPVTRPVVGMSVVGGVLGMGPQRTAMDCTAAVVLLSVGPAGAGPAAKKFPRFVEKLIVPDSAPWTYATELLGFAPISAGALAPLLQTVVVEPV